jgi:dihydroorotase
MSEIVRYPVFVDPHVHFREPGTNMAESISSGSHAAVMGGYGYVFDMPNNPGKPTWTTERVLEKHALAHGDSYVHMGFYAGWQPDNNVSLDEFAVMSSFIIGKKDYLTRTTANDRVWEVDDFMGSIRAFHQYTPDKPNMVHPDNIDQVEKYMVDVAKGMNHPVHICHVNDPAVARMVAGFRDDGYPASSGVTPHHLTKTSHDVHTHGKFAEMMPPLADQVDCDELLYLLDQGVIDVVETDHAPHSYDAKMQAEHEGGDCFGVPGVESAFPILRYQVRRGRLSEDRLVDAMSTRPAKIMGVKIDSTSYSEWDLKTFRIDMEKEQVTSAAGWSPYLGNMATGRLVRMVLHGQEVYSEKYPNLRPLRLLGIEPVIMNRE